jgi:hypothetical protein
MPQPIQSEISRSYNSFAGSDIKAVIGQFQFAELQAVSYAITREKAPIYTMGSADPRSYSRNKRGIAGNLIWINFDRHALLNLFHKAAGDKLDTVVNDVYGMNRLAAPWYSDQVLPFDITLAGANEYGAMCAAKILGVEILNEGTGISVDDAVSEGSATFVARAVEPMQAVPSPYKPASPFGGGM